MKKNYQKPDMNIVRLRHTCIVCASNDQVVTDVDGGDTDLGYGGGGSGIARGRQNTLWGEDDWDE